MELAQPTNPAAVAREASNAQKAVINQFLAQPPPGVDRSMFAGLRQVAPMVPMAPIMPAVIDKQRAYIFRSRPGGVAKYRIRIPATPPPGPEEGEKRYQYTVGRFQKKYGDQLATYDALAERNGGWYVDFTTVVVPLADGKQTRECYFQTDDPDLAAFVRQSLSNDGRFYEDVAPLRITVGGKEIEVTVTNDAERAQLLAALAQQGHVERAPDPAPGEGVSGQTPDADVPPSLRDKNGKPLTGSALSKRLAKLGAA